jgi:nitroreductase
LVQFDPAGARRHAGNDRHFRGHEHDAGDAAAEARSSAGRADQQDLAAAQWAPSGGNTQRWRFLVVKDPEIKKKVQVYYKRLYDETVGPRYSSSAPPPGSDPARYQRQHAAVKYLTDHYHEAPVWIVACLEDGENPDRTAGSSIYPAVQNMLLATRALGLGTTLTTRHTGYGNEVDAIFGLPSGVHSYAILPIGWPMGRFGPLGRGPLKDVVFQDQWGKPPEQPARSAETGKTRRYGANGR